MNFRLLVPLLALSACGSGGTNSPDSGILPVECPTHDGATFELGTGQLEFEPILPGQRLPIARGAQGGCHFFISAITDGFAERRFNIQYEVFYAASSTTTGSRSSFTVRLRPVPELPGKCQNLGTTAFLIRPWNLADKELIMEVNVRDDEGRSAQARTRVVAEWPADLPPDACGPRS
jgi:hypothetical protein